MQLSNFAARAQQLKLGLARSARHLYRTTKVFSFFSLFASDGERVEVRGLSVQPSSPALFLRLLRFFAAISTFLLFRVN
jgi:hypothetical protein